MKTTRLEAFSDGVIAIILTIMVLELRPPDEMTVIGLYKLLPTFLSYLLSYVTLGIYWVNHHHLLHLAQQVTPRLLWWNMNLLFWMSLIPFVTANLGKYGPGPLTAALYSAVMLFCSIAFYLLRQTIADQQKDLELVRGLHRRMAKKNAIAAALYAVAAAVGYFWPWASLGLVALPTLMYFFPDRRVEQLREEDLAQDNGNGRTPTTPADRE